MMKWREEFPNESNSSDIDTDLRDLTQKDLKEELDSNDTLSIDIPKINSIMKERHRFATIK